MKQKSRRKIYLLVLLLIVIFAVSGTFAVLHISGGFVFVNEESTTNIQSPKQMENNGLAIDGVAESKTEEQVLTELQKKQINVTDKISSYILFPSGRAGTKGSWSVENLASNNLIMQCEVYIGDQQIARTVPIKPNQHTKEVPLLTDLAPGVYDAVAYIHYYETNTNEYISKAGYQIKVTVQ